MWDAFIRVGFCISLVFFFGALAGIGFTQDVGSDPESGPQKMSSRHAHVDTKGDLSTIHALHLDSAVFSHQTASSDLYWPSVFLHEESGYDDFALDESGRPFALRIHLPSETKTDDNFGMGFDNPDGFSLLTQRRARRQNVAGWRRN